MESMTNRRRLAGLLAGIASASLVLAGCGTDDDDGDAVTNGDAVEGEAALEGEEISIAVFEGWDEGIVASFLMGHVFETEGATVTYDFADVPVVYTGVAEGQFDISFDAWLPSTHEDYWAEHGDNMESLVVWYDDAPLTIAVNEDAPIESLAELPDHADTFGSRVVGIEPGSGLNRITREVVFPTYGLEDAGFDFIESSTAGMLGDLQAAIDAGEDVVVTLWRPHWAYAAFPIRDLDDPENALGDPEEIHAFGRAGFSDDLPAAADLVSNFRLTPEELIDLEDIMVVQNEASTNEEYAASIEEWLDANPDWIDRLKAGEL
jgi:glycine betaine/proline transport system substrate-binding protein